MATIQGLYQGQKQQQVSQQKIQLGMLMRVDTVHLPVLLTQMLQDNVLFEEVEGMESDMVSIEDLAQEENHALEEWDIRSQDAAGNKMSGDGPTGNEIPDDRKSYLAAPEDQMIEMVRQINLFPLSDRQKDIALMYLQSIDHRGYVEDYDNPASHLEVDLEYSAEEIQSTYAYLRKHIHPAGMFARDDQDFYMLQAERIKSPVVKETLMKILDNDIQAKNLNDKKLNKLKDFLRMDNMEIIDKVYAEVEKFRPAQSKDELHYNPSKPSKQPDFMADVVNGKFKARLTDDRVPQFKKNKHHAATFAMLTKLNKIKDPAYLQYKENDKEMFDLEQLAKKRNVILEKVMTDILNAQKAYLETGDPDQILPLLMKEIAEKYADEKMDASLISRIAAEKTIQIGDGNVITSRELFSLGVQTRSGQRAAIGDIKNRINGIVLAEDHNDPKTVVEIEKELKEQGFHIGAKRVRKLMTEMGILDYKERKANNVKGREENLSIIKVREMNGLKQSEPDHEVNPTTQQFKMRM